MLFREERKRYHWRGRNGHEWRKPTTCCWSGPLRQKVTNIFCFFLNLRSMWTCSLDFSPPVPTWFSYPLERKMLSFGLVVGEELLNPWHCAITVVDAQYINKKLISLFEENFLLLWWMRTLPLIIVYVNIHCAYMSN